MRHVFRVALLKSAFATVLLPEPDGPRITISFDDILSMITKRPPQRSFVYCAYAGQPLVEELRTFYESADI
jgi:hypothetical protein